MSTTTITPQDAQAEIDRRKVARADRPTSSHPAARLSGADLHTIVSAHVVEPTPTVKAEPTSADAAAAKKAKALRKRADKAFQAAAAKADPGDRIKAGIKARRLVLDGTPLTKVLALIAE